MDFPPDSTRDQPTLDQEIPDLRALADLYVQAKALILYSEEVDPDSRSNLQVIKELRDALDHLMRVMVARVGTQAPTDAADPEYASRNIHKAIGHIYRAAFDALDGTVLSLRVKITQVVESYPLEVLNQVVPNYWDIKRKLNELSGQVTEHRARKDVGAEIGATLDGYVSDVEAIKRFYSELLCCGPALDEYAVRLAQQERKKMHRDWLIALGSAVIGGLIGVLATVFLV